MPTTLPSPWLDQIADWALRFLSPSPESPCLRNFGYLGERLCRGAQPSASGFALLRDLGVDTVVNLRMDAGDEEAIVRGLGMAYVHLPMRPFSAPTHDETLAFLRLASDAAHGRLFFHCYFGADRTGVMAACYRFAQEGWSLDRARAEMEAYHFHELFQQPMQGYLAAFEDYWASLGTERRAEILHRC